jgi:putative tryptophan/tyrosine transport system substrate-binding protein
MRRRDFIKAVAGSTAIWPTVARAQQTSIVGYLSAGTSEADARLVTAFQQGLSEVGYIEGRNVHVEYRFAANQFDQLPLLAADLVSRRVAAIATPFYIQTVLAAKAATSTIPIIFSNGDDPVALGLVASLNRPGGNVTGITGLTSGLMAKRLGLLHDLRPEATRFAVLINPKRPDYNSVSAELAAAGSALGAKIEILAASSNGDIEAASSPSRLACSQSLTR